MGALTLPRAALTGSEKFADDGFYAFRDPVTGTFRIMWAAALGDVIALSDDELAPVDLVVTAEQFDEACWGIFHRVSPDGFPIERKRP
ncbi:hypothetical protein [Aureimonas sp. AU22]|uniref:hypothetical protein n=1 Tax=Aureimonas sp. AU22 TaxID=1638162 RepID=UPI000785957F|nr:hypothetical protein [Aureimonas sp. AU22]